MRLLESDDAAKLAEMKSAYQKLEAKYETSEISYRALVGALIYLHGRFSDEGTECEPLIHAVNTAALIKQADSDLPIAEMAEIGAAFFAQKRERQASQKNSGE